MESLKQILTSMLIGFLLLVQYLLLGFGLSAVSNEGVSSPSILLNFTSIPNVLFMIFPVALVYIIVRSQYLYEVYWRYIRLVFIIIFLIIADISGFMSGGYSVYGLSIQMRTEYVERTVNRNHPKNDGAVQLLSMNNQYYYNKDTEMLYLVSDTYIDEVERKPADNAHNYLYRGVVPTDNGSDEYLSIDVLQLGESTPTERFEPLEFTINDGSYIYSIDSDYIFQDVEDFYDVYIDNIFDLEGDGYSFTLNRIGEPDELLGIEHGRHSIVYAQDDEHRLTKSREDKYDDVMDDRFVDSSGNWRAYIETFSLRLDGYVRVSNYLDWSYDSLISIRCSFHFIEITPFLCK